MWWNFIGRTHDEIAAHRAAWQEDIGVEPADPPTSGSCPDHTPSPRFGRFPAGMPAPLPAPALPGVQLQPRG